MTVGRFNFARMLLLLVVTIGSGANEVSGIRIWQAPDNTRLVFDLSTDASHRVFSLANPDRIVIDLSNTAMKADTSELELASSGINSIRYAVKDKKDLRVVLDLKSSMRMKSFVLPPIESYGHRLVLDLIKPESLATSAVTAPAQQTKSTSDIAKGTRPLVIVIDAGHGGEDPGAIGPSKTKEKHIVLAIARSLYKYLEDTPGFKPVLIRDGDYYVPLQERRDIARRHKADLFVSIHADAFTNPAARGASIYALSQRGATSATARYLADRENATDTIGGVNGVSLENKDDVLRSVLVGMSMDYTLRASLEAGQEILSPMGRVAHLHKHTVEQAGFAVLKSPDIPSILVETGFISNPTEEKNLGSKNYREKLAKAIAAGIDTYFQRNPVPGTWLAERGSTQIAQYEVVRGDTLSAIAVRYNTSAAQLRTLNGLKNNQIRIGQVLKVPNA